MRVSVVIATYNGDKYIQDQIYSILNQTIMPNELVISDDGSNDETISLLTNLLEPYKKRIKIKILRNNQRLGYTYNFENGIKRTEGEIVFLSDQDDYWFKNKIEKIIEIFKRYQEIECVLNNAILTDSDLNSFDLSTLEQIDSFGINRENYVLGSCSSFRGSFLKKLLPMPSGIYGHEEWFVRISDIMEKKFIIDTPLQYYRRHNTNVSNAQVNHTKKFSNLEKIIWYIKNLVSERSVRNIGWDNTVILHENLLSLVGNNIFNKKEESYLVRHYCNLSDKVKSIKARYEIRKTPLPNRLSHIIKGIFLGVYCSFGGFKGVIKDIYVKLN